MISIKNVYDTVLFILNKENRGYITKDEFNSLARQTQLEVFESYFTKQALSLQSENDSDYSNPTVNIDEKITFFDNTYIYSDEDRVDLSTLLPGTNVSNYFGFQYPSDFYRLGLVQVLDAAGVPVIADEVEHKNLTYIRRSPLTAPTSTQPVFVRHESGIRVFPQSTAGSQVEIIYLRKPVDPVLRGVVVNSVFVEGGSTNFELHPSEEHELVAKILAYSGVIIRDPEVVQVASQKEQQIQATEQ